MRDWSTESVRGRELNLDKFDSAKVLGLLPYRPDCVDSRDEMRTDFK